MWVIGIFHEDVTLAVKAFCTMGGIMATQFVFITFNIIISYTDGYLECHGSLKAITTQDISDETTKQMGIHTP
jgi:hypothetical protein